MMNPDEKRKLDEIERSLELEDPWLAQRIRTAETVGTSALAKWATRAALAGAFLAVAGLYLDSPLSGLGILTAVTGLALRLAAPAFTQPPPPPDNNGEPGTSHDGART